MLGGDRAQSGVESVCRSHHAHVRRRRFSDHGGDIVPVDPERFAHGFQIVVRKH